MATAVASAYSDPDKEIISHYRGEVSNLEFNHTLWKPAHVSQGLETALKCCYENIEDTLTVPPEVCLSTLLLNWCHHSFQCNWNTALMAPRVCLPWSWKAKKSILCIWEGSNLHQIYWSAKCKIGQSHICFLSLFDKLDLQVRSSLSQALFLPWCIKFKFNFSFDIIGPCQPARHEHQNCPRIWDQRNRLTTCHNIYSYISKESFCKILSAMLHMKTLESSHPICIWLRSHEILIWWRII